MKKSVWSSFIVVITTVALLTLIQPVQSADNKQVDRLFAALGDLITEPQSLIGSTLMTGSDFKAAQDGLVPLDFAKGGRVESRIVVDQPVTLDVSAVGTFYIDLTYDNPDLVSYLQFYLKSDQGWYSMSTSAQRMRDGKTVRYRCQPRGMSKEGTPTGLHKITLVRLAFYPKGEGKTNVRIHTIFSGRPTVGVIHPSKNPESPGIVRSFHTLMSRAGIECAPVPEQNITLERIKGFRLVMIPISGRLEQNTVDVLCDYVDQGGQLGTFCGLPEKLMKKLGFKSKGWMRCNETTTRVAKVVFEKDMIDRYMPFMPAEMYQNSGNISWGEPLTKIDDPFLSKEENRPRIAAWWYDPDGKKTQYPAMLWSGRGFYFAHILQSDDSLAKERFLLALCTQSNPAMAARTFHYKWKRIASLGYVDPKRSESIFRERIGEALDLLAKQNCSLDEILSIHAALEKGVQNGKLDQADLIRVYNFVNAIDEVYSTMSINYAKKVIEPVDVEARFLWGHSGLGPYPGDWDRTMRELAEAGFNGIVPNMCWGGSASYHSDVLPVDKNCQKYGDQIAKCVAAGKKYGVEVHVWKVNYNCGHMVPQEFVEKMRAEGRLQCNYAGTNDNNWLCPSHPANQDLEVAAMLEIATKYDVDGIHFDYIRFPSLNYCYCPGCKERFSEYYHARTNKRIVNWPGDTRKVKEVEEEFLRWRREQITAVVKRVSDSVRKSKPKLMISCAARSAYPGTRIGDAQDWIDWCDKGYLDFVCPMNYTDSYDRFDEMVSRQEKFLKHKVPLYAGIGIVTPSAMTPDILATQIVQSRSYKTGGFCLFALTPATMKKLIPQMKETSLRKKAIPPHRQ